MGCGATKQSAPTAKSPKSVPDTEDSKANTNSAAYFDAAVSIQSKQAEQTKVILQPAPVKSAEAPAPSVTVPPTTQQKPTVVATSPTSPTFAPDGIFSPNPGGLKRSASFKKRFGGANFASMGVASETEGELAYTTISTPGLRAPINAETTMDMMKSVEKKTGPEVVQTFDNLDGSEVMLANELRMVPLLDELDHDQMEQLARAFTTETVEEGSTLLLDSFYFILDGSLELCKSNVVLVYKVKGDFLNPGVLMSEELGGGAAPPDGLCLKATAKTTIARLTRGNFLRLGALCQVFSSSPVAQNFSVRRLAKVPLLSSAYEDDLMALQACMTMRRYPPRGVIASEGDLGNSFYILVDGTVAVKATQPNGKKVELEVRSAGDHFGEISLLEDIPRVEVYQTKEHSTLLQLSRTAFMRFLSTTPDLEKEVHQLAAENMSKRLASIALLSDLDTHKLLQLATLFQVVRVPQGDVIFLEGSMGDTFYIILSGVADVLVNGDVKLAERVAGEPFGEIALLESMPRTATLKASQECLMLTLTRAQFEEFMHISPGKRAELQSMAVERMVNRLSVVPLFSDLSEDKRSTLVSLFKFERLDEGKFLFREGDTGENFYIILKGSVEVLVQGADGKEIVVDRRKEGECFGEVALLENAPRTASVRGAAACVLLQLSRQAFNEFLKICPEKMAELQQMVSQRLVTRISHSPFFADLTEQQLGVLVNLLKFARFGKGETICTEGEAGDLFYIILAGSVDVIANSQKLETRQTGECFGEVALLSAMPRTATMVTAEPCVLVTLARAQFEDFLSTCPEKRAGLEQLVRQRVAHRMSALPTFSGCDESKLAAAAAHTTFERHSVGDSLFAPGEEATTLFIVLGGCVTLSQGDRQVDVEVNGVFGVSEMLAAGTRSHSATVKADAFLLAVASEGVKTFLDSCPDRRAGLEAEGEAQLAQLK